MKKILACLLILSCRPMRELVVSQIPNSPTPSASCVVDNAQRCEGDLPVACHAEDHRWWPMLSRNAQGAQRVCLAGCREEAGVAYCAPAMDAAVDAE